jgi:hypothetical protein
MVEKLVSVSVITLQKLQCSAHAFFFLWSSAASVAPTLYKFFVPEMLAENFMKKGSRNLREFLVQFVKS